MSAGNRHESKPAWPGVVLVAAAGILWGTLGIVYTLAIRQGIDTSALAFWRASLAAIAMVGSLGVFRPRLLRIRLRDVPFFVAFGVLSIGAVSVVYILAVDRVGVATAAVLLYTAPAWVTILAWQLYDEPLTRIKVIALLLAFAGTALAAEAHNPVSLRLNASGLFFGLASGFTYAMYTILGRRALVNYSPITTVTYSFAFAALALVPLISVQDVRFVIDGPPALWATLAALALGPTVTSFMLYTHGLEYIEAGAASIIATLEVVSATVLGFLVLDQRLTPVQTAGGILILIAVTLLALSRRRPGRKPDLTPSSVE
ncbi:MAG: DMT family transporter [Anaerolineae bacterium]